MGFLFRSVRRALHCLLDSGRPGGADATGCHRPGRPFVQLRSLILLSATLCSYCTARYDLRGSQVSPLDAAAILEASIEKFAELESFSYESWKTNKAGQITRTTIYVRRHPDGTVDYRREPEIVKGARASGRNPYAVTIANSEGTWRLRRGVAMKIEFPSPDSDFSGILESMPTEATNRLRGAEMTLRTNSLDGIACFAVKVSYPPEAAGFLSAYVEASGPTQLLSRSRTTALVPAASIFYINRSTMLPWAKQDVGAKGEVLRDFRYVNLKIGLPAGRDLFTVPDVSKLVIVKSLEQYADAMKATLTRRGGDDGGRRPALSTWFAFALLTSALCTGAWLKWRGKEFQSENKPHC